MTEGFEIVCEQHVTTKNIQHQHEGDGTRVYCEMFCEIFPLRAGLQLVEVLVTPDHAAPNRHCNRRWSDVGKNDAWVSLEVVLSSSLYVFLVLATYTLLPETECSLHDKSGGCAWRMIQLQLPGECKGSN